MAAELSPLECAEIAAGINADTVREQQQEINRLREVIFDLRAGARVMLDFPFHNPSLERYAREVLRVSGAALEDSSRG